MNVVAIRRREPISAWNTVHKLGVALDQHPPSLSLAERTAFDESDVWFGFHGLEVYKQQRGMLKL